MVDVQANDKLSHVRVWDVSSMISLYALSIDIAIARGRRIAAPNVHCVKKLLNCEPNARVVH